MMAFITDIEPDVTIWYHQDLYRVQPSSGRGGRIAARYAQLTGLPIEGISGGTYTGVAATWARHEVAPGVAFIVELAYGALIGMRNVTEEQAHPFLFAEGPRLVFPFARRIVADAVRDAGYPPLLLDPIDFNGLYMAQLAQAQATATAEPAGHA